MTWSEEAFQYAQKAEQFIYLSIGNYSSRWSNSMQKECFKDIETAQLMNTMCVCILVDSDERPDITELFSDVCQIQNGGSGIPLNILLTPDGEPFFAATWLPKRSTPSVPGLVDILPRTKWLWITQRDNVYRSAKSLTDELKKLAVPIAGGIPGTFHARAAFKELKKKFDNDWGGFTSIGTQKLVSAPKLIFLLDFAGKLKNIAAFKMVEKTLNKMWLGGIHDHVGGGFFESTVDERWIIPSHNKNLADQALLLYTAALMRTTRTSLSSIHAHMKNGSEFELTLAQDVGNFILNNMTAPESIFYSSIGCVNESCYLWTDEELRSLIPPNDYPVFRQAFSVMQGGNFRNEITGFRSGLNILYMNEDINAIAEKYFCKPEILEGKITGILQILLESRNKRTGFRQNDQAILSLNGLAIAALAFAGRIFENKDWILASERALLFCQRVFPDPKGNWRRRYREKMASVDVQFIDLAYLIWGAIEVHLATNAISASKKDIWLKFAESLIVKAEELFTDNEKHSGGFFATDSKDEKIVQRKLCADRESLPGENAVAVRIFSMLAKILEEPSDKEKDSPNSETLVKERLEKSKKYRNISKKIAATFVRPAAKVPSSYAFLLGSSLKI
jgi:uncharacterized protein YyaL (SSP411 family)